MPTVLTINTGSSSLKAAVFRLAVDGPVRLARFTIERIGSEHARASVEFAGVANVQTDVQFPNHSAALEWTLQQLNAADSLGSLTAVGHRIVHGGAKHSAPELMTPALLADLRDLIPIDPEHLPQAIGAIEAVSTQLPEILQVALFDTYFHESMPEVARALPLPAWLTQDGVRRYGFHGLSYESTLYQLRGIDPVRFEGRLIIAHLGAGASMVAVHQGKSLDTTMGFTPTGGLMMGTRPGDLDPGLLIYLLQVRQMSGPQISDLLNKGSGLLGVSETSQDMRDLLAAEPDDPAAALAIDLFCHIARKHLAALTTSLGGLDTVVFTGGIGEHSPAIRARICRPLVYLGVTLDSAANEQNATAISAPETHVQVLVLHADEETSIARQTARFLDTLGGSDALL